MGKPASGWCLFELDVQVAHRHWPERDMVGWELDEEVVDVSRKYLGLADHEEAETGAHICVFAICWVSLSCWTGNSRAGSYLYGYVHGL